MKFCNNCGVELESYMNKCPLCGQEVSIAGSAEGTVDAEEIHEPGFLIRKMSPKQKNLVWNVLFLIFLAMILVPLVINLVVSHTFSWSQYPMVICLSAFIYITLFAFWKQGFIIKLTGSFIVSAILLVLVDSSIKGISWPIEVAIPILFTGNLITAVLYAIIIHVENRGINIIAFVFLGSGFLCLGIETIISFYRFKTVYLSWSLITVSCAFLIFLILIFLHYKLKWGRNLEKTFHL
ncbi:DUF6320 domain-containing protein [Niabella aquatica]